MPSYQDPCKNWTHTPVVALESLLAWPGLGGSAKLDAGLTETKQRKLLGKECAKPALFQHSGSSALMALTPSQPQRHMTEFEEDGPGARHQRADGVGEKVAVAPSSRNVINRDGPI